MPGTKDYISVNSEGTKVHLRNSWYCDLKETYLSFKEQNPEKMLGLSKFVGLETKSCMLTEASSTHATCVPLIRMWNLCQVVYSMTKKHVKTYDDVSKIIFTVSSGRCYQGDWDVSRDWRQKHRHNLQRVDDY
jgi:hypothetical protein